MNSKQLSRKQVVVRILIVAVVLLAIAAALLFLRAWQKKNNRNDAKTEGSSLAEQASAADDRYRIRYQNKWYALRDNVERILLVGLDEYDDEADKVGQELDGGLHINNQRSDFLLLLSLDKDTNTASLIHLNRDSMADMNVLGTAGQVIGSVRAQLALSHAYGTGGHDSCRNTVKAVSNFLYDLPIDHYVAFTMDAVGVLNDAVGGVTVNILDDMTMIDPRLVKGEDVKLEGDLAIKYVRTRYHLEDTSNAHRMIRQRQYLDALYAKTQKAIEQDESFLFNALVKVSKYIVSDYSILQMQDMLSDFSSYKLDPIYTIEGESILGEEYMEFYPDEDKLQALLVKLYFELV